MLRKISAQRLSYYILAWLIACIIGMYFRFFPYTHNVSSDAYEQGTMLVINKIRETVTLAVNKQFPQLTAAQKEQLIKEQFDKLVRENKDNLRKAFDAAGQNILNASGEKKHYLLASDSYYFLGLTQDLIDHGYFGSREEGSKFYYDLMLAPAGYWQPKTWHPYIGAFVYKIMNFFKPDTDVMFAACFAAIFTMPFVLWAFYYACRRLGCGLFPTFIASVFFILAPIYLKRSTFAWYDDDAYSVFFPLLFAGFLFQAINQMKKLKKAIFYFILISISLALYSFFWYGWGFYWALCTAAIGIIALLSFIKDRPSFKASIWLTATILISPFIAIGLLNGFPEIWKILTFAAGELQKFIFPALTGWPDLFIVVGELRKSTFSEVIELSGGPVMFFGGILSLTWLILRAFFKYDKKTTKTSVLLIFFAVTFYLALSAQRFTILCMTPLALLFAFGLHELWCFINQLTHNSPSLSKNIKHIIIASSALILIASLAQPIHASAIGIRTLLSPIFNSAWERSLVKLRENTPINSVINTWWSPGHFVKAVAKRGVTFDGASIKGEQAYWLTQVYLSQTEEEALGILRMLNVSSNQAAEYLQKIGLPLSAAVPLLRKSTLLDRETAYNVYKKNFSTPDADKLIAMTHGTPPPSYVLIYNEIVDGNVMLGYLGKWNFKRIEELNANPEARKKVPSRSSPEYINFLWSLVGGPYRQSPTLNPARREGEVIVFDHGLALNTKDLSATIKSPQFGTGIPASIFYSDGSSVIEKRQANATLPYSVVLFKESPQALRCVLLDRIIANSLIARMYYFDGLGLKNFKLFSKEADLTGRTKISIFEVKW